MDMFHTMEGLHGCVSEEGHGPWWRMASVDDSISGVGNFERVAQTVQWAAINRDHSTHGDRVDSG
jgi:hypothetical protein